jgi:hypothetical protein
MKQGEWATGGRLDLIQMNLRLFNEQFVVKQVALAQVFPEHLGFPPRNHYFTTA